MEANQLLTAAVYSVITLIVTDLFIRFTIMKLKYMITTLLVEYSTVRILYDGKSAIGRMRYCSRNIELK